MYNRVQSVTNYFLRIWGADMTQANVGQKVKFTRHGFDITGEVTKILERSVIVSISEEDALLLDYGTNFTVVSHENYKVVENA